MQNPYRAWKYKWSFRDFLLVPTLPDERWITCGRSASSSLASCKDRRLKCWIYWVGNMCKTDTLKKVANFQLTQSAENNCMSLKDMVPKSVFSHSGRVQQQCLCKHQLRSQFHSGAAIDVHWRCETWSIQATCAQGLPHKPLVPRLSKTSPQANGRYTR